MGYRLMHGDAAPARPDDTPVIAGQHGPRRRATLEEIMVLVDAQRARYATGED